MARRFALDPRASREIARVADVMLGRVAGGIERDARRYAPVDTGELRAGISAGPAAGGTVRVWSVAPHGLAVEFGTRPHVIEPSSRRALTWPGGAHPVTRVDHPGTRAQPYMRRALYTRRSGGR